MKKAIFGIAALVVLLAVVAIVSCNMGELPQSQQNEEPGISLNISGGSGARALTGITGENATTYYEASFKNIPASGPNTYVRTFWNWNTVGKIQLLPGNYEMILFAGRGSDKTLLGVGRVIEISDTVNGVTTTEYPNASTGIFAIKPSTTGLVIEVKPLVTDVGGSYTPANSTFKITANSADSGNDPAVYILYNEVYQGGDSVPVFHLAKGQTATAKWRFGIGPVDVDGAGEPDDTNGNYLADYSDDIFVVYGKAVVTNAGFMTAESLDNPMRLISSKYVGPVPVTPGDDVGIGTTGFTVDLEVPNKDGLSQISIEVPVVAYNSTIANPQTWWIRGGLNSVLLDVGAAPTSGIDSVSIMGGAIVVGYGVLKNIPDIIITLPGGGSPITPGTITITGLTAGAADVTALAISTSGSDYTISASAWAHVSGASSGAFPALITGNTYSLTLTIDPDTGFDFSGITASSFTFSPAADGGSVTFTASTGELYVEFTL